MKREKLSDEEKKMLDDMWKDEDLLNHRKRVEAKRVALFEERKAREEKAKKDLADRKRAILEEVKKEKAIWKKAEKEKLREQKDILKLSKSERIKKIKDENRIATNEEKAEKKLYSYAVRLETVQLAKNIALENDMRGTEVQALDIVMEIARKCITEMEAVAFYRMTGYRLPS